MAKWTKDRSKRRGRKPADTKEKGPAPEPLQPRYFDSDLAAKPPLPESVVPSPPVRDSPPERELQPRQESQPVRESPPRRESQMDFGIQSSGVVPSPPEPAPRQRPAPTQRTGEASTRRPTRGRRSRRGGRGESRRSPAPPASPVSNQPAAEPESSATFESSAPLEPSAPFEPSAALEHGSTLEPAGPVDALPVPNAVIASSPEPASADTVAAELRPAVPRPAAKPSKGSVVLAIGLPGSGKSSWFKRHNIRPLSSDLLRELLFDNPEEQRFQDLVFSNLRSMLKARLIARRPMNYIDATNLNPHERHSWIKLAKDYGYDVQGLFFDVPIEVCLERHARRGRVVPEDIMRKMAAKLKPPTFDEGFSKITVVRVKKPA